MQPRLFASHAPFRTWGTTQPTQDPIVLYCISIGIGYFAYDTWDYIQVCTGVFGFSGFHVSSVDSMAAPFQQSGLWRKSKHIVVHHFAVLTAFWLGMFLVRCGEVTIGKHQPNCS